MTTLEVKPIERPTNRQKKINLVQHYLSNLLGMEISFEYAAERYDEEGKKILDAAGVYLYTPKSKGKRNRRAALPLHGLPVGYERHWDDIPVSTSLGDCEFSIAYSSNGGAHNSKF